MKLLYLFLLLAFGVCGTALAQPETGRVSQIERRVSSLEQKIRKAGDRSFVLFLFGAFCALWAQNTARNA